MSRASKDPLLNTRLGAWELEAKLGEGAMCAVYRARNTDGSLAAIKVLQPSRAGQRIYAQRLRREAAVSMRLAHPRIVKALACGTSPRHGPFVVMELLEGRNLHEELSETGAFTPLRAARIIRETAEGLAAAHAAGYIHRDLKPGNLMLCPSPDGEHVKILDFGIVGVAAKNTYETKITEDNLILGTPSYMAPEQFDSAAVTPAADLYALGAILYHLLAGSPPFVGAIKEVIAQHLVAPPDQLPHLGGLGALAHHLLEKAPDQRPASAQEVIERLDVLIPALECPSGGEIEARLALSSSASLAGTRPPHRPSGGEIEARLALSSSASLAGTRPPHRPSGGEIEARLALSSSASLERAWFEEPPGDGAPGDVWERPRVRSSVSRHGRGARLVDRLVALPVRVSVPAVLAIAALFGGLGARGILTAEAPSPPAHVSAPPPAQRVAPISVAPPIRAREKEVALTNSIAPLPPPAPAPAAPAPEPRTRPSLKTRTPPPVIHQAAPAIPVSTAVAAEPEPIIPPVDRRVSDLIALRRKLLAVSFALENAIGALPAAELNHFEERYRDLEAAVRPGLEPPVYERLARRIDALSEQIAGARGPP